MYVPSMSMSSIGCRQYDVNGPQKKFSAIREDIKNDTKTYGTHLLVWHGCCYSTNFVFGMADDEIGNGIAQLPYLPTEREKMPLWQRNDDDIVFRMFQLSNAANLKWI